MKSVVLLDFDDVFNISKSSKYFSKKKHLTSGWNPESWREAEFTDLLPDGTKVMRSSGEMVALPDGSTRKLSIVYNLEAVDAVNSLAERGVDVLWQSSWAHDESTPHLPGIYSTEQFMDHRARRSKEFLESLGFKNFDAADADGSVEPSVGVHTTRWWKYRAAEFVVDTGRWDTVTWLDNDLFRNRGRSLMQEYCESKGVEFRYANIQNPVGVRPEDLSLPLTLRGG